MKKTSIRELRWSFCWNLVHHKEKNVYTMYAQTEEQKRRWIKAIEDALTNIQPEECRRTDHLLVMNTFEKGASCSHCGKFMKGLFFQGYKCVRCAVHAHRECISQLHRCGIVQPPELPPRPPLLPIVNPMITARVPDSPSTLQAKKAIVLDQRLSRDLEIAILSTIPLNHLINHFLLPKYLELRRNARSSLICLGIFCMYVDHEEGMKVSRKRWSSKLASQSAPS
ncbi:unnamed protein product [Allacma fusca]|uniref:Uncharacterized protein n=1 Tax=Allacma fusca TaxID=39272 RepID=A0A8J2K0C5_9HEXA|nr:unnamed protein product [Allacma fusca]